MFDKAGKSAIFLETVFNFKKMVHTVIHVIPLDKDIAAEMPMFFKVTFNMPSIICDFILTENRMH